MANTGIKSKNNINTGKSNIGRILSLWRMLIRLVSDFLIYIIIFIFALYLCHYSYNFCYQVFGSAPVSEEGRGFTTSVSIETGLTTMEVAERLENKGLILDKNSFYVKVKLSSVRIVPGSFVLSSDMDYDEILDIISVADSP